MAMMDKPLVIAKVHKYMRQLRKNGHKVNNIPRAITLNYNNICNFKCEFCFSAEADNAHLKEALDFDTIRRIADEADKLGIWEIVLTGGELLVQPDNLFRLIAAFDASRFQMVIITNGYLLDEKMAYNLAAAGIDCVGVSLSGMDEKEHMRSRGGVPDSHARALKALDNAEAAGMAAWPNLIFGHHNAKNPDLYAALDYAKQKGYTTYLMMAMPYGSWKDNIMTAEDLKILEEIRQKYDCCFDTWDMYDKEKNGYLGVGQSTEPILHHWEMC